MIYSNYQFFLTLPDASVVEVFPYVEDLAFSWAKEEGQVFYRFKVDSELIFLDDPGKGISDFSTLFTIENSADRCETIEIEIKKRCGGVFSTFFSGYLNLTEGQWNLDACQLTITPQPNDDYTCWYRNWKEEKNILDLPSKVSAKTYVASSLEEITCLDIITPSFPQGTYNDSCISPGVGWTVKFYDWNGVAGTIETTWVRENAGTGTQPPGAGWINDGGDWVRAVPTKRVVFSEIPTELTIEQYEVIGFNADEEPFVMDNGVSLENVIDLLNPCAGTTVVSNFFSINADGSNPSNDAYTEAQSNFDNLHIWQKTDAKNPEASENATGGDMSWKDLVDLFANAFQVYAVIDGGTLRIEHISYYENNANGLDLTSSQYAKYLRGTRSYSYDISEQPIREKFEWMDKMSVDFSGLPIEYDNSCTQRENIDEKVFAAGRFSTDIEYIQGNPDGIANDGFFIAQIEDFSGTNYIPSVTISTTSNSKFNGLLSFPYLHEYFWRHHRPFPEGDLNGSTVSFLSTIRTKAQATITAVICCGDLSSFDPEELIQTDFGWGELIEGRFKAKGNIFELDIKHE
jgi:hypothetical protein